MDDDKEQKQHAPTGKRLTELNEKGQTLRSKDLSGGMLLFTMVIILLFMGPKFKEYFINNYYLAFTRFDKIASADAVSMKLFEHMVLGSINVLLPFFILIIIIPFLSVFILGGWNFSFKAVRFKWETLDLFTNLGNLFGKRILVDITKSSIKFFAMASIAAYFIMNHKQELFSLPQSSLSHAFSGFYDLMQRFVTTLLAGVVLIAGLDSVYSFFDYHQRIKMTLQEIKDEAKESNGSPEVKRKMRSMMITILKQKINQMVPQADVIVTNPTHYAVALKYREGVDKAPKVIAKGKGPLALYIRTLAVSKGVPIYEAPPLARAIFHTSKLGTEVKPPLYVAVALVLSYINQLRYYQMGRAPLPMMAENLEIPPEYIFNR
ncbi:MAG TPA: flagellar type III secretion system protein FlhB [Gammaproteobacteria bacterium]|nr:flagellar type III secretion system protein FlhB [Gammaproteobacteria bacterium]